ncbi:MAG: NrfD/PsrC family molybdoenzyme membrane anchor subunit [Anaerolineae bacterium]
MLRANEKDKAKLLDPLFSASPRFWGFVLILLVVMGWGGYMYARQLLYGLGETGMQRPVFWGVYMVNFIFFIGISHAGTLISAILRVTGAEWRRPITRVAEAITVVALVVGSLQIIVDIGRPERLLYTLQYGRLQSPLLWDVISVTAYFLGSVTYLYLPLIPDAALLRDNFPEDGRRWQKRLYTLLALGWRGNREQWLRLEKAIAVMAVLIIPIAVSVHTIISWILATTVQPGWHSTIFGPYFVVGAIFSGIGALFVAMTVVRRVMGLEDYITTRQYQNLGLLFIVMNAVWMYFTYAEHLTLAAGQQTHEFPVLASKLWGDFAPSFWTMVGLMVTAFWIMVVPLLLPDRVRNTILSHPAVFWSTAVIAVLAALSMAGIIPFPGSKTLLVWVLAMAVLVAGLSAAAWYNSRPVGATVTAAIFVLVGMWLERWNIVAPTMTHPYLVDYSAYRPTMTEVAVTAASFALFLFLFALFFKLFPAVSVWEVAEGRVIEAERAKVRIPLPEPAGGGRMTLRETGD